MKYLQLFPALVLMLIASCQQPKSEESIKSYNIDFNWGEGGPNAFPKPGLWADASPEDHIKWYKDLGVNTIQTFCVSCNGYAWYKNGFVPEQPGLKYDFLPEMVKLGHKEGMKVFGYFCIGANTKWGIDHPDLSYGYPSTPHIPFTDQYLTYLDAAIRDAVTKTGIDGFMADCIWLPDRKITGRNWIESEKQLYKQLTGKNFPGEDKLTANEENNYGRLSIERCWKVIHKAAKETNSACLIWLTCNEPTNPMVTNSVMFKEVDWLMNEAGDVERTKAIQTMIGPQTRILTCLANWNKQDPKVVVPAALKDGVGLFGFRKPEANSLLPSPENLLSIPIDSLKGDDRNIATLIRVYKGLPLDYVKK